MENEVSSYEVKNTDVGRNGTGMKRKKPFSREKTLNGA
jgi:hypothetical protein